MSATKEHICDEPEYDDELGWQHDDSIVNITGAIHPEECPKYAETFRCEICGREFAVYYPEY